MSQKASKFLIGGVRFRHNFFGGNTVITGIYGGIEHVGKVAPLFLGIYAISKLLIFKIVTIIRSRNCTLRA